MKKKFTFFKTLLVAAGLLGGSNAWADAEYEYRADFSQNFEDGSVPASWTLSSTNNASLSIVSCNGSYALSAYCTADRTLTFTPSGDAYTLFTTSETYKFEFDWGTGGSNGNESYVKIQGVTNAQLFHIGISGGISKITTITFYKADGATVLATEEQSRTLAIATNIYHITIEGVYGDGVYATVTKGGSTIVEKTKVLDTFDNVKGIENIMGKSYNYSNFDNVTFSTLYAVGSVTNPTATMTAVSGTGRYVTLTQPDDVDIYYYITGSDYDYAALSPTKYTEPIYVSDANNYIVYYADNGSTKSEYCQYTCTAGVSVSLATPSTSVTALTLNANGLYYQTVNASCDNSDVLLAPNATVTATFNGSAVSLPYAATSEGTLTITATCSGYETSSVDYEIVGYAKVLWQDFTTLTEMVSAGNSSSLRKWSGDGHWELAEGYGLKAVRTDSKAWVQINKAGMVQRIPLQKIIRI